MSERDPLDELSRALFQAAREEAPRDEVRSRASDAQLAASAGVGDASHARPLALQSEPVPALERPRGLGAGRHAVAALAVAACAVLVWALARHATPAPSIRADETERIARATVAPPRASAPAQTSSAPAPEQPALARPEPEPTAHARASTPAKPPPATLSEELVLLDQARSALSSGDAPRALALLDRYDSKLRATHLNAEAALLRIEALAKSGRAQEARKRARHFIEVYPDSPLADRARALLGSVGAQAGPRQPSQGSAP